MSVLIAALLVASQPGVTPEPTAPPTANAKPKQVCAMVEVTGSRARKRVCRDATGRLDLGPGVSDLGEQGTNQRQRLISNQPSGGGGGN